MPILSKPSLAFATRQNKEAAHKTLKNFLILTPFKNFQDYIFFCFILVLIIILFA
jgi:hypothetical protein